MRGRFRHRANLVRPVEAEWVSLTVGSSRPSIQGERGLAPCAREVAMSTRGGAAVATTYLDEGVTEAVAYPVGRPEKRWKGDRVEVMALARAELIAAEAEAEAVGAYDERRKA